MPNKCISCGKIHPDDAPYLLEGCDQCKGKFFFYMRKESLEEVEKDLAKLTKDEVKEMEKDIRSILPEEFEKEELVILDLESIRVVSPGKYKIDVTNLLNQRPIVIRTAPGKYILDLSSLMGKFKKKADFY